MRRHLVIVLLAGLGAIGCTERQPPDRVADANSAGATEADQVPAAAPSTSASLSAPPAQIAQPESVGTMQPEKRQALHVEHLQQSFAHPRTFAVVEGVVLSSRAEVVRTRDPNAPETIATRHVVRVRRAWKSNVPVEIEVWTYGGVLPPDEHPDFRPRGMGTSHEASLAPGDAVILALSESVRFAAQPALLRALNGQGGVLRVGTGDLAEPRILRHLDATYRRFEKEEHR